MQRGDRDEAIAERREVALRVILPVGRLRADPVVGAPLRVDPLDDAAGIDPPALVGDAHATWRATRYVDVEQRVRRHASLQDLSRQDAREAPRRAEVDGRVRADL